MPSVRIAGLILAASLLLTVALATVGNLMPPPPPAQRAAFQTAGMAIFFGLFLLIGYSAIPVMVHVVFSGRVAGVEMPGIHLPPMGRAAIVWSIWALMTLGLIVALPFATADGFFGPAAAKRVARYVQGPSRGTVVATVGMTTAQVRLGSTLPLAETAGFNGSTTMSASGVFDFRIAGSNAVFARSRYVFIVSRSHGSKHVESVNVGISPDAMPKADAVAQRHRLLQQFRRDGWKPQPPPLSSLEKGLVRLDVTLSRVDEEVRGERPDAGRWIEVLELSER